MWSLGCVCTHSSQRLKYNVFPPLNAMFSALVFPSLLLCVFITVYYKAVCEGRGAFGNRTQNSRVDGARPNHQADRGSDPNHQGIWSPPRAGQSVLVNDAKKCKLLEIHNCSFKSVIVKTPMCITIDSPSKMKNFQVQLHSYEITSFYSLPQ